ncbi:auxin-induced protein 5NG4 [Selaginella moellendorffii]|nr:auxin-induced protein 5NG4 [Selaginella moellendorffii]|eukprot:XP_002982061.2 auxin-induced protein 5NG4 [Selaginella moellendorffii]
MNNDNSSLQNCAGKLRLYLSLGATQALFAGFEVLSRVALDQGVGKTAFTVLGGDDEPALLPGRPGFDVGHGYIGHPQLHPYNDLYSAIVSNIMESHILHFFTRELHYKMVSWHLGAIFLLLSGLSFALFLILQAPVLKSFPAPVTFASMSCLSSVIQLPIVGEAFEPQWNLWTNIKLGEALSIVYAGVIGSGIVSGIQSWAVKEGGPVVVAAYQPLETIITACLSYFFLKESLRLGTLVGGLTIISGLYLLIWGQRKEREANEEVTRKATEITLVLQPSRRASFIKPVQVFNVEQRGI